MRWWVRILQVWLIVAVALVATTSLLILAILFLPARMVSTTQVPNISERLKLQNDVRTTLVQALGGLVLIGGAYFTWRTIRTNKEGQITERYTRAIDQIGSDKVDVRVGGIFALERIARESRRDRAPVSYVLAAFIRHHSELENAVNPQAAPIAYAGYVDPAARPPADVQAALTVLGRRDRRDETKDTHIDLSGIAMVGADLRGAHLERAWLVNTVLAGAHLEHAHLEGALLYGANLEGARLEKTHLEDARLDNVRFYGARLYGTHLEGATVHGVVFDRELMRDCHLEGLKGNPRFRSVDELPVTDDHIPTEENLRHENS